MRKRTVVVSLVLVTIVLHAQAQKAWESEGINPELWYRLPVKEERAYIFTHWERMHPHAILKGADTPRVYKRDTLSIDESIAYELDGQTHTLRDYIEKADISGLMVLRNGEVRLEFYGQGLDAESRNHIWSATKSFTSTLVGMALFDGKISSLDDPAQKYAPQFMGTAYGETSIRHLLMMSSGVDFFHHKGSPNRVDMYNDLLQEGADYDKWAAALGRRVPGGTDFNYLATDTHVISAVLRGAYGKPFPEIVQKKLWQPFGFGRAQWGLDFHGHATGHWSLALTLEDFAHLGQLYLEDLMLNGKPTVTDDWIEMVSNAQATFAEPSVDDGGNIREGYSFQFWLPLNYDEEFMASGAFKHYLWIDKKREFVVAQFSISNDGASAKEKEAVFRALGTFVTSKEFVTGNE